MLSSFFSDKGKVTFVMAGLLLFMYAVNIVARLQPDLEDLRFVSLFYYYDASAAVIRNQVDDLSVWVMTGATVLFTLIGWFWFRHRDVAV